MLTIEDVQNIFLLVVCFVIPLIVSLVVIIYFGGSILERIKKVVVR